MRNFIGIDPGIKGAYAIVSEDYKVIRILDFKSNFLLYRAIIDFEVVAAVFEDVWIQGGPVSAKSSTTFMKNAGGIEAVIEVLQIPHVKMMPQTWQKRLGVAVQKTSVGDLKLKLKSLQNEDDKKLIKKQISKIKRDDKIKLKEKSADIAKRFFSCEINRHDQADALNMARVAVDIFSKGLK